MKLAKALIPLLAALALPGMASAQKMDNPFSDSPKMYVNPAFTANANAEAAKETDATLKARMQLIGQQPGAVWMDRISALASLEGHLDATLAQGAKVFLGIVYDLPGRDCAALASNGELPGTAAGLARYKTEYIDEYARIVGLSKFSGLRVVLVIEPDSLPNLVTNLSDPECGQMDSSGIYAQGVQYAVNKLGALSNTYLYIDAGHSGWLGWPNNMDGWVSKMGTIAAGFTNGKSAIHGFVDDTANTLPLKEPFLATGMTVGGQDIKSSKFYDWNPFVDEAGYSAELYRRFTGAGWPSSLGIVLDTSRNGWGGSARPTAASTSTVMDTFVNASRVDRRNHRGLWCNPSGAGIGELPKGAPADWSAQHWDAFLWVKPPGESDGNSYEIPNDQGKSFDHMCDPTYTTQYGVLTGALPNAPLAGDWFPAQFKMLVQNIYPIPGAGPQCQGVPTGPTNLVVSSRNASQVALSWTAGSAPPNCTLSYTVHRGTTNNFTPSASTQVATGVTGSPYTVSGLSPNTTYYFMVQAVDQIGAAGSNYIQTNTENGYTLTVTKAGTGTGTVAGGAINCGSTCSTVVNANPVQTVTLTATAASGSSFTGWTGCTGGTGATCLVEMNGVRSVTATFGGATQTYALTVTKSGTGTGTVTGGGINCGSTCSASIASGTLVTLTAAATSPSTFTGWSGACNGTAATCTVTMSAAQSVGAAFTSGGSTNYTLTVTKSGTGTGTVSGGSISCGSTCSVTAASGTTVTLTAAAASGSTFSGWSGACTGTGNCVVTLTANQTATATFAQQQTGNTPVAINGRLQRCGNRICNSAGTAVQFKGMSWFWSNTTWGAERFYNASAVQSLATDWKASIVRAAIGVHGGGGYYSGDSLTPADPSGNMARAKALIDGAIAAGVYVIVDWHSHELHQAEAQAFFQTLATQYANVPNIIWEPFNEPPGTTYSWSQLKTYHTAVVATIRAAGSQNLVVVGSPNWSQDVDTATSDPLSDSNVAYTLHFYAGSHGSWLRDKANTAMSRNQAVMVTEWGTVDASGDGGFNASESANWTAWMDQNKISSCNWSLHDKVESASALVAGASSTGPWSSSDLTQSGTWVKAYISANSQPTQYALTVTKSGSGSGTVTSSTGGISCGSTCSATLNSGTVVTLTAAASSGSTFAGWSGACSGTGTCTVTMSAAQSVTATFNSSIQTYALTVTKSGSGSGTVTSSTGGISCGSTCSASYTSGTTVTLTAAATSPSTFGGWSGACSGTGTTCTVTMSAARSVTATFNTSVQTYALTVTKSGSGSGTVTSSTGGISCGSTCSASYTSGTTVTLTAAASSGSTFAGWSGACSGTGTCTVTMSAAQSVTATFNGSVQTYALTVAKSGSGAGTVTASSGINCGSTCSASYTSGTVVTLTAAASSGSTFAGWSGACSGTGTCTVTMSAAQSVTATFNTSGGSTPCANPVTFSWASGNFNTTGAACFRTSQNVRGWGCSNMDGRTVSINGTAVTCGAGPFPLAKHTDGYVYFSATAGQYPWASFYVWE